MRILILTQNYYPEPDQKMHILAKELLRIGHDVKVITGFPNYPQGKIYPSYRQRIVQKEVIEGISLIRLPLYPDKSKSVMKRSLNYLSFPFSAALLGPLLCGPADVMLVYHPPVTLGIPAWVISAIRRVPFIYEIQDMWPETLTATGMMSNAFLLKTLEILGNLTYRRASAITVISPGFKRNLVFKGIDSGKIRVFYNWAYEGEISPAEKDMDYAERYGLVDRFNIIYAGNLGPAQGLNNVVDAAVLLTDIKNLQFVLVGGGINLEEVKKQVKVRNLRNVMLLPRVPIERMPGIYALADALMIHLSDDPLFEITIPGKTQSYLLSGRPIIASVNGDTADLIIEAGAGLAAKAMDPRDLARVARKMYNMSPLERDEMGRRGRAFYFSNLAPNIQAKHYDALLQEVLMERNGHRRLQQKGLRGEEMK